MTTPQETHISTRIPGRYLFLSSTAMGVKAGGTFLLIMVLARLLSGEDFGLFTYYLTIASLVMLLLDYGFTLKLTKDIASTPDRLQELVWKATRVKTVLLLACGGLTLLLRVTGVIKSGEFTVAALLIASSLALSFVNHFAIPFRVVSRYRVELFFFIASEALSVIITTATAALTRSLVPTGLALLGARLIGAGIASIYYARTFGFRKMQFSFWDEIRINAPYFLHFAIGTLYLTVDTILLRFYVSPTEIGIYQAGIRLSLAVTLPVALGHTVLLPRLMKLSSDQVPGLVRTYALRFIIAGAVISTGMWVLRDEMVAVLYGPRFATLSGIILPFCLFAFLRFTGTVHGTLLTASGRQGRRVLALSTTLILVTLGVLTVAPDHGIAGVAWVQVGAQVLLVALYWFLGKSR